MSALRWTTQTHFSSRSGSIKIRSAAAAAASLSLAYPHWLDLPCLCTNGTPFTLYSKVNGVLHSRQELTLLHATALKIGPVSNTRFIAFPHKYPMTAPNGKNKMP